MNEFIDLLESKFQQALPYFHNDEVKHSLGLSESNAAYHYLQGVYLQATFGDTNVDEPQTEPLLHIYNQWLACSGLNSRASKYFFLSRLHVHIVDVLDTRSNDVDNPLPQSMIDILDKLSNITSFTTEEDVLFEQYSDNWIHYDTIYDTQYIKSQNDNEKQHLDQDTSNTNSTTTSDNNTTTTAPNTSKKDEIYDANNDDSIGSTLTIHNESSDEHDTFPSQKHTTPHLRPPASPSSSLTRPSPMRHRSRSGKTPSLDLSTSRYATSTPSRQTASLQSMPSSSYLQYKNNDDDTDTDSDLEDTLRLNHRLGQLERKALILLASAQKQTSSSTSTPIPIPLSPQLDLHNDNDNDQYNRNNNNNNTISSLSHIAPSSYIGHRIPISPSLGSPMFSLTDENTDNNNTTPIIPSMTTNSNSSSSASQQQASSTSRSQSPIVQCVQDLETRVNELTYKATYWENKAHEWENEVFDVKQQILDNERYKCDHIHNLKLKIHELEIRCEDATLTKEECLNVIDALRIELDASYNHRDTLYGLVIDTIHLVGRRICDAFPSSTQYLIYITQQLHKMIIPIVSFLTRCKTINKIVCTCIVIVLFHIALTNMLLTYNNNITLSSIEYYRYLVSEQYKWVKEYIKESASQYLAQ